VHSWAWLSWVFVAYPSRLISLRRHGQCFVPLAASASRCPPRSAGPKTGTQEEGGPTTLGRYVMLNPDRVNLCGKGRSGGSDQAPPIAMPITPLLTSVESPSHRHSRVSVSWTVTEN
jgi:hypothetical protein